MSNMCLEYIHESVKIMIVMGSDYEPSIIGQLF